MRPLVWCLLAVLLAARLLPGGLATCVSASCGGERLWAPDRDGQPPTVLELLDERTADCCTEHDEPEPGCCILVDDERSDAPLPGEAVAPAPATHSQPLPCWALVERRIARQPLPVAARDPPDPLRELRSIRLLL